MNMLSVLSYDWKRFSRNLSKVTVLSLLILSTVENHSYGQSKQEPLSIEAIRLWREHSVSLSDNGKWYTTLYNLKDKPESIKDTVAEQNVAKYYADDNQTDVLYIFHAQDGLKYQVPDGNKPVFSSNSEWIAYQIKPETEEKKDDKDEKEQVFIELKHLESGFTVKYESDASYQFLEDKNYFITADKNSLLVYDLENRREHYIGNTGEYLTDKKADCIAYTIASEDKRGNGVYLYDPSKMTTRALQTGNFTYSNLSWNHSKDALAFYKYNKVDDEVDYSNISIVVASGIGHDASETIEYLAADIKGFGENMGLAVNSSNEITWSKDGDRLFLKVKEYDQKEETKEESSSNSKGNSSVQVWHWKDKKLLSERIMEYDEKKNETFHAIFFRDSKSLIQLTGEEIQELNFSKGTDQWAVGTDNRKYISDWDFNKNDLYSINLTTGEKKLILQEHSGSYYSYSYEISPNGEKLWFWDEGHHWVYDFEKDKMQNITEGLSTSFIDVEYDKFGYVPSYGFTGWVKGMDAVIVNHKHDLWLLPLDNEAKAQSLTASFTGKDSIRFRIEDSNFKNEDEIANRYIDLTEPLFLYGFNTDNKYAGYFRLHNGELRELLYGPYSFSEPFRSYSFIKSKKSDAIIYHKGDYQNYLEAYLSSVDFKKSEQITHTNPQQEKFRWGKRILIDYKNNDGVPLKGILSVPDGYKKGQKLPMIVYSYEKESDRMYQQPSQYLFYNALEMLYVSDGYLFLRPDIHFNVGTPHSDMHECIDNAIQKVINLGYVDENRIGYQGHSFGGHTGMYVATQENKFAAIAAGAGVSNLVQGFNIDIVYDGSNEQDYYMVGQGRLGTDPTSDTDMYIRESAVFNAQKMNTPLLLIHGTEDPVVQWEHSFGFYSILRYLKKPVIFLSYRGERHVIRKEENRLDLQRRFKEYFDHYLKGKEAKKWMTEGLPYIPEKESKEKDKRTLPKWK